MNKTEAQVRTKQHIEMSAEEVLKLVLEGSVEDEETEIAMSDKEYFELVGALDL